MRHPSNDEIANLLVTIITHGFNRSVGALESAGALDTRKMRAEYKGVGSKHYDLVTEQMEYTAKIAAPAVRKLFFDEDTS
jgi:hypothetical protein